MGGHWKSAGDDASRASVLQVWRFSPVCSACCGGGTYKGKCKTSTGKSEYKGNDDGKIRGLYNIDEGVLFSRTPVKCKGKITSIHGERIIPQLKRRRRLANQRL